MNIIEPSKSFSILRQKSVNHIKNEFGKEGASQNTELTPDEEQMLVNYCLFMARCSHTLSASYIKTFAWAIICKSAKKLDLTKLRS